MFVRDGTEEEEEEKEKGRGKERCVPDSLYRRKTREWRRDCGWTLLSTWRWKNDRYHRCRRRVVVGKADYPKFCCSNEKRVVLLARKKLAESRRATR